jgi:carbon monoxide dehydrogenase subunit G
VEQTGEYRVAVSRDVVWQALNDPDVLARCLEGCESMERLADDRFDARLRAKVGPVRAAFRVALTLEDVVPPERYAIQADAKGGAAGFARGQADVRLTETDDGTTLSYRVTATVGGKLAQVGNRLIDGTARKMADEFFGALRRELDGEQAAEPDSGPGAGGAAPSAEAPTPRAYESGGRWPIWVAAFLALLLGLLFAFG